MNCWQKTVSWLYQRVWCRAWSGPSRRRVHSTPLLMRYLNSEREGGHFWNQSKWFFSCNQMFDTNIWETLVWPIKHLMTTSMTFSWLHIPITFLQVRFCFEVPLLDNYWQSKDLVVIPKSVPWTCSSFVILLAFLRFSLFCLLWSWGVHCTLVTSFAQWLKIQSIWSSIHSAPIYASYHMKSGVTESY